MRTAVEAITKTAEVCGGDACIRGTRITVWSLVQWQRLGKSDEWILKGYPSLDTAQLRAAWEYAAAHSAEIDQAIRSNAKA
jgi:uncharacterized protein (DUF433 family)